MINFLAFRGYVTAITDFGITPDDDDAGCYKMISVINDSGNQVNFILSPNTFVVDHQLITVGDLVTGYYNGDAPAILIYPPQYEAIVMVKESPLQHVKVDYFDLDLVSNDGQLKINLSPGTQMLLTNGQAFTRNPANRNLIVVYGPVTKSIPAQTTPYKIIVLC